MFDEREIRKTINIMKPDGQLFEIRVIFDSRSTYSGYFRDADTMIDALKLIHEQGEYNIYITLNSLNDACYDRTQKNRLQKNPKATTSDKDVSGYEWLMIDLDPKRPTGTSSTDEQIAMAKKKGNDVYKFMRDLGFEQPILGFSGNGVHLLYKVRLKNSSENKKLMEKSLKTLDMLFSTDDIDVDMKNFNPSRVCKLYGTVARKGTSSEKRPHRLSKIVGCAETVKPTDIRYLEKLCELFPKEEKPQRYNNYQPRDFDLDEWLSRYGVSYRKTGYSDGTKYILDCCPFDSNHKGKDACIFRSRSGAIGFHCFHNSCSDKTWRDVRMHYEPDAYEKRQMEYEQRIYSKKPPVQIHEIQGNPVFLSAKDILNMPKEEETFIKSGIAEIDKRMRGLKKGYVSVMSGLRACVDADTEYFNGRKWKRISEFEQGEKVLQYNADGTASLVYPEIYHKHNQEFLWRVHTQTLDMCASENHEMVYVNYAGKICKKKLSDIMDTHEANKQGFGGKFLTTFECFGRGIDLTDEQIRVMCMVICDGYIKKYVNIPDKCRVKVKKERKKNRARKLLRDANIEFFWQNPNRKDGDLSFWFIPPLSTKEFTHDWYRCNRHQMEVIADEIIRWDGHHHADGSLYFFQCNKKSIDFIQFVFTCLGKRTPVRCYQKEGDAFIDYKGKNRTKKSNCYELKACKTGALTSIMNPYKKNKFEKYPTRDGYMYCFTVPSHMLVLRRSGKIYITGNCGKSSIISQMCLECIDSGFNVGVFSGELAPKNFMRWMNLQGAGKGYVEPTQFEGYYSASQKTQQRIANWMQDRFLLWNNNYGNDFGAIRDKFQEKIEENKLDLLILDNLMAFNISGLADYKYDAQTEFVWSLQRLAKEKNVHILFVAHPRKAMGFLRLDDISGTADIGNAVDNAFIVHRVNSDFERLSRQTFAWKEDNPIYEATNVIEIAKDRDGGTQDYFVPLFYESETKRLKNFIAENKIYGWNRDDDGFSPLTEPTPFDD